MFVLVVVVAFVNLGLWQLRRLDERRARNAVISARLSVPEVPIGSLAGDPLSLKYRRVTATGTFDTAREVILPDRSLNGRAGNIVVTPLRMDDGRAVIVERGWVPLRDDDPPIAEAAPPAGTVVVNGVVFPSQTRGRFGPKIPPDGTLEVLFRIDIPRYAKQLPYAVHPMYVQALTQTPPQTGKYPIVEELPKLDEGPHLSYAMQWFAFALIALVGYGAVIRKTVT